MRLGRIHVTMVQRLGVVALLGSVLLLLLLRSHGPLLTEEERLDAIRKSFTSLNRYSEGHLHAKLLTLARLQGMGENRSTVAGVGKLVEAMRSRLEAVHRHRDLCMDILAHASDLCHEKVNKEHVGAVEADLASLYSHKVAGADEEQEELRSIQTRLERMDSSCLSAQELLWQVSAAREGPYLQDAFPTPVYPRHSKLRVLTNIEDMGMSDMIHKRIRGQVLFWEKVHPYPQPPVAGLNQLAQRYPEFAERDKTVKSVVVETDRIRFLLELDNAWLDPSALVYDQRYVYQIGNNVPWAEAARSILSRSAPNATQKVLSFPRVFVLSQLWAEQVYHFFAETLTRLMLAYDWLVANPDVSIVMPGTNLKHVRQSMMLLGLAHRLVEQPLQTSVFASKLYFARPTRFGSPTREEARKLSRAMVGNRIAPAHERNRVVLIVRPASGQRSFGNLDETAQMIDYVRKAVENVPQLTLELFTTPRSLVETIDLFQRAAVIIGGEGAGLVNALWAHKGTIVMELNARKNANWCHFRTSTVMGQDHYVVEAEDSSVPQVRYRHFFRITDPSLRASMDKQLPIVLRTAVERLSKHGQE